MCDIFVFVLEIQVRLEDRNVIIDSLLLPSSQNSRMGIQPVVSLEVQLLTRICEVTISVVPVIGLIVRSLGLERRVLAILM